MGMSAEDILQDRLPETTPADTPAAPDAPTSSEAPAGTPKRWAGKYDSPDALEAAYLEAQRKITEESERRARLEALLLAPTAPEAPVSPGHPTVPTVEAPGEFITREEAIRLAEERAEARMRAWQQQWHQAQQITQEQAYWRDEFFRRHPDLKDDLDIVQLKTAEVAQRYAHLPLPTLRAMMPTVLDEIATKSRERLGEIKARKQADDARMTAERAAAAGPAAPGTVTPPPAESPPPTPEQLRIEAEREAAREYYRAKRAPTKA
jgi:hypothetical protein